MADHDDFLDDYIEYQIFEDSMKKGSGGGKTPKRNTGGSGCSFWLIIIMYSVPAAKALQSIHPGHTAPLHIQQRAGAIIPEVHTPIVRRAVRAIRETQANRTQAIVLSQAANLRAAQIPMTQSPTLTRMTSTMITTTISGIMKMPKITGTSINKAVFLIRLENSYRYD